MVKTEVGEGADGETNPADPLIGHRVAGDLYHRRGDPVLAGDREQRVQVGRLRRRAHTVDDDVTDAGLHRADEAGGLTRGAQARLDKIGGGGLAGGSGDADDRQVRCRLAVRDRGGLAEHEPRLVHDEHHDVGSGGPDQLEAGLVGEHRSGARVDRRRGEPRAVIAGAGQRRIEVAGPHRGAVMCNARDGDPLAGAVDAGGHPARDRGEGDGGHVRGTGIAGHGV